MTYLHIYFITFNICITSKTFVSSWETHIRRDLITESYSSVGFCGSKGEYNTGPGRHGKEVDGEDKSHKVWQGCNTVCRLCRKQTVPPSVPRPVKNEPERPDVQVQKFRRASRGGKEEKSASSDLSSDCNQSQPRSFTRRYIICMLLQQVWAHGPRRTGLDSRHQSVTPRGPQKIWLPCSKRTLAFLCKGLNLASCRTFGASAKFSDSAALLWRKKNMTN